jgi:hypothetical protein
MEADKRREIWLGALNTAHDERTLPEYFGEEERQNRCEGNDPFKQRTGCLNSV